VSNNYLTYENSVTGLDMSKLIVFTFYSQKPIKDITASFTDPNFKAAVCKVIGKPSLDAVIYAGYIDDITSLDVTSKKIVSLSGIEHFTALNVLSCSNNQLTALDLSKNTALTMLYCSDNKLTVLDLSNNTALDTLYCSYNRLSVLDLSNNTALKYICVNNNLLSGEDKITGLDKSKLHSFVFNRQNIVEPSGLTAILGQSLSEVELPDGWSWVDASASVGGIGMQTHKAKFVPSDTAKYSALPDVSLEVEVKTNDTDIATFL
jgi:Leucine-rich repeat (LRR) protein